MLKKKKVTQLKVRNKLDFFKFDSKTDRILFYLFSGLFGLFLLGAMASTICDETNWFMWGSTLFLGLLSCWIWIFKGNSY